MSLKRPSDQPHLNITSGHAPLITFDACVQVGLKGAVHMTGGGFPENLPRVLPKGCACMVERDLWRMPEVFRWLQSEGALLF